MLKALNTKTDGLMPTKKVDLFVKYHEWRGRLVWRADTVVKGVPSGEGNWAPLVAPEDSGGNHSDENKDYISAMLMLNKGLSTVEDKGQYKEI